MLCSVNKNKCADLGANSSGSLFLPNFVSVSGERLMLAPQVWSCPRCGAAPGVELPQAGLLPALILPPPHLPAHQSLQVGAWHQHCACCPADITDEFAPWQQRRPPGGGSSRSHPADPPAEGLRLQLGRLHAALHPWRRLAPRLRRWSSLAWLHCLRPARTSEHDVDVVVHDGPG